MENLSAPLTKTCNACGKTRKRKGIMYHPDNYLPYCEDPYICNEFHPNTPANLIKRGSEIEFISFEEAEQRMLAELDENTPDKTRFNKIRQLIQKPASIRFQSIREIEFLLDLKDRHHLSSLSDTVRFCVNAVKGGHIPEPPIEPEQTEPEPNKAEEPTTDELEQDENEEESFTIEL